MSLRITFDKSIFHGEDFTRLLNSPVREASRTGRISIYPTPILIEETLNLLLKPEKGQEFKDQLKFILDVANGRWFNDTGEIWSGELEGKSRLDYLFLSRKEERNIMRNLKGLVEGESFNEKEFQGAMEEKGLNRQKAIGLRKTLVEMRVEIARNLRNVSGGTPFSSSFESYYESNWLQFGSELIRKHVQTSKDIEEVIKMWAGNSDRFPYFTLWTRAMLYTTYYAMANHNAPVDQNTQMDLSLIVMAKDLEAVVSNDHSYMKSLFLGLYGDSKQYLTSEDLIAWVISA